jgi:putative tryptophan/tyrosine transport system substrate-binding protein
MRVKGLAVVCIVTVLLTPLSGQSQGRSEIRRVGYVQANFGGFPSGFYEALREGLQDLGYQEGRNLALVYRASDDGSQVANLVAELLQLKSEVIVAPGGAASIAQEATKTVPIVFSYSGDPIEAGFVKSLARPGANMTGITWLAFDLVGKRLEFLKEAAPRLSRVAVLANPAHPGEQRELAETQNTARAVGATVQYHQVKVAADFDAAFEASVKNNANALLVFPDGLTMRHRGQIAEFAAKRQLPSVFGWREYVDAGGLMSYGPNRVQTARRLAVYVDKILRGAKPSDLPVEQPTKFELVINLKTAKALGLTIPQTLLLRADQVIE